MKTILISLVVALGLSAQAATKTKTTTTTTVKKITAGEPTTETTGADTTTTTTDKTTMSDSGMFYTPVPTSRYKTMTGKTATIEMQVGFSTETEAKTATAQTSKIKSVVQTALKETKADLKTKEGKMALGTEITAKLQEMGMDAKEVLFNTFTF